MLVFIDESGDAGMQGKKGSSEYFIVTAVVFEDLEDANDCDLRIDELRAQCFRAGRGEFHFNSCCREIRERFLTETGKCEYVYLSFAFNKSKLYGEGFQYKNSFYKYAVNLLFENVKPYLNSAIVVFDSCGNREFRQELKKYLTRRVGSVKGGNLVKKIKTDDSCRNNLLQLADMVCGAMARFLRRDKADRISYRRIISHREVSFRVWPR